MSSSDADRRLRLIQLVLTLPTARFGEVEDFFARLQTGDTPAPPTSDRPPAKRDWPHAPLHRLNEQGTYIVTSSTYDKAHYFRGPERLDYLEAMLLSQAKTLGWQLEAWAVFSNHYHFVAHSPPEADGLSTLAKKLHHETARYVNELDQTVGRPVWFNFWDTRLTFEKSYLARLSYVHRNPVKHGLVSVAARYPWCSAAWLERTAPRAMVATLYNMKIDRISIQDEFDPI